VLVPPRAIPHRLERRDRNRNLGDQARALGPRGTVRNLGGSRGADRPTGWLSVAGIGWDCLPRLPGRVVRRPDLGGIADRAGLPGSGSRRGDGRADLCRPGDNPVPLSPPLQHPVLSQRRGECLWRAGAERRARRRSLAPDRPRAARIVSRRDAVHARPRNRVAQRDRERRGSALLLGQERSPHRGVPRSRKHGA